MKRSRRVILTMMGSGALGAVSTGFAKPSDCGVGFVRRVSPGLDGRPVATCRGGVAYGGFGGGPARFHGHGHAHGGG